SMHAANNVPGDDSRGETGMTGEIWLLDAHTVLHQARMEVFVNDNYGYNPQQEYYDPTVSGSAYPPPPPSQYPDQSRPAPALSPVPPNPVAQSQSASPVYVPCPVAMPDTGDPPALSGLIFGIIAAAVGWIPVCGLVALIPAILGIVFGSLGLKSQRRRG